MTMQTVAPVRREITVAAPLDRAFEVFTAGMGRWWNPPQQIGERPLADVLLEPREGGLWAEVDDQGTRCPWGRVLVWEPPTRVVLAWQIGADWRYDPDLVTEVEVTFAARDGATHVVLEHRHLERLGEVAAAARAAYGSEGGWGGLLGRYAAAL